MMRRHYARIAGNTAARATRSVARGKCLRDEFHHSCFRARIIARRSAISCGQQARIFTTPRIESHAPREAPSNMLYLRHGYRLSSRWLANYRHELLQEPGRRPSKRPRRILAAARRHRPQSCQPCWLASDYHTEAMAAARASSIDAEKLRCRLTVELLGGR